MALSRSGGGPTAPCVAFIWGFHALFLINRNIASCVSTWKVLYGEREEMTLANPALYVWLGG